MSDILVLCIGNTLMGDDGVGPAVLAHLTDHWDWPDEVTLVDGRTRGASLLPYVQDCSRLLLVDAIDARVAPGTVLALDEMALSRLWDGTPVATHDETAPQLLAMADALGRRPREVAAIGVQPQVLGFRPAQLSRPIAAAVELAAEAVVGRVTAWGARPWRRQASLAMAVVPRRDATMVPPDLVWTAAQ